MSKMRCQAGNPGTAAFLSLALLCTLGTAAAQEETPWVSGPTTVRLGDVAEVDLAAGHLFADADATKKIMEAMGNRPSGQEMGLITSDEEDSTWFVVFEYDPAGYVSDDDQDDIDADAILKSISDATEAANEWREENGVSPLHVTGWAEPPHYDSASNNLVWAMKAADEQGGEVANYNVRLLGRRGYMSVTLVTDVDQLAFDKPQVEEVLAGFGYTDGHRYGDYISGDKLAGYGLAALVAGGAGAAAAKLGFFAVIAKFLGKIWKLAVVGALFLAGLVRKLFRGTTGRGTDEEVA